MVGSLLSIGVTDGLIPLQEGVAAAFGTMLLLIVAISGIVGLISLAGMWKVFEKAGQPGWAAIIPIYNVYIMVAEIAGRDIVWVVLGILFPIVLIVPFIDIAKAFGKGAGYGIGLYFLSFVFFPMLGFGDARYQGAPN